jgi:hypothetical protein
MFIELHSSRGEGAIRFVDFHAYECVTGTKFRAWELSALRRADQCYLAREAERLKSKG